ncbi:MAG: hypothetical protein GWP91_14180 [Rhodobacterales bacterium]|nr:hypothetical protein [Rhodobacterales bacterium]
MRKIGQSLLLVVLAAGLVAGKKKNVEEPAVAPVVEPAAEEVAAEPAPEPEVEPEPEPEMVKHNADFTAKLTFVDGQTTAGHVIRVERSDDWFAERGWTDKEVKLTVTVEGNGTEKDLPWTDIKSMDISYDGTSAVDCTYDSEFTPIMYMCVMKTHSKVAIVEGGSWAAAGRHKWKFTFEDGNTEEFWIYKISAREQEAGVAKINDDSGQDTALYQKLQNQVAEDAKGHVLKRLEITAP